MQKFKCQTSRKKKGKTGLMGGGGGGEDPPPGSATVYIALFFWVVYLTELAIRTSCVTIYYTIREAVRTFVCE